MADTNVLEAPPEVVIAPTAVIPAPAAPEKLTIDTFERDAAKVAPDALKDLTPKWTPPKMVQRGNPKEFHVEPKVAPVVKAAEVAQNAASPEAPVVAPTPEASAPSLPEGVAPVDPNSPDHPKNWKMKAADAKEALFFQLRKSGVPIDQAYGEVYGSQQQAVAPTPEPISEPEPSVGLVEKADQQITSLAAQSAELEAKIDEVAETDPKTALKLTRQQADIKLQLSDAKKERDTIVRDAQDREVSTAVETHRALENKSLEDVRTNYPELTDAKSEKRAQFNLKVAELEKNPAYGKNFRNLIPGWPLMVAKMVDAEKGWSRQVVAPATPKPMTTDNPLAPKVAPTITAPPVRATSAEVITPGSNLGGSVTQLNGQTFWKDSANIPPAQLIALMGRAPLPKALQQASNKTDPRTYGA